MAAGALGLHRHPQAALEWHRQRTIQKADGAFQPKVKGKLDAFIVKLVPTR